MSHEATLHCPVCGVGSAATAPTDACLFFWECPACRAVIRPKAGDCCVFCSYGSAPCPPKRAIK
ncbi:MAG TPA: GDCCVxC domain-containing (seleno)protein [Gemmatimonadales bacterium]|nr:GDCCVxC domain-containing (seleno)protein [Gemmatimonadales bacterium]